MSEKRKTKTSTEVKAKYNAKTYKRYTINLRTDTDFALIAKIEENQSLGISPSATIKSLLKQ